MFRNLWKCRTRTIGGISLNSQKIRRTRTTKNRTFVHKQSSSDVKFLARNYENSYCFRNSHSRPVPNKDTMWYFDVMKISILSWDGKWSTTQQLPLKVEPIWTTSVSCLPRADPRASNDDHTRQVSVWQVTDKSRTMIILS